MAFPLQFGVLAGTFAGATLVAELAGAANLGTAMTFGQIAFILTLFVLLLRG